MHTWLVGICERLQNLRLVVWLVTAQYAYPFIQWTHFTGLSLWLGTTLALDFRLLGAGKRFQTAAQLSDALLAWHIFVQRKSRTWGRTPETPAVAKLAGLMEIVLWVSVATAAVWIPNY